MTRSDTSSTPWRLNSNHKRMAQMTEPAPRCARCGAALSDGTPDGLCTGCLLGAALSTFAEHTQETKAVNHKAHRQLGNNQLLNEIARGAMGVVFRARQRRPDRLVALKVIAAGEL